MPDSVLSSVTCRHSLICPLRLPRLQGCWERRGGGGCWETGHKQSVWALGMRCSSSSSQIMLPCLATHGRRVVKYCRMVFRPALERQTVLNLTLMDIMWLRLIRKWCRKRCFEGWRRRWGVSEATWGRRGEEDTVVRGTTSQLGECGCSDFGCDNGGEIQCSSLISSCTANPQQPKS